MNSKKQPIKQAVKIFYASKSLSDKQVETLQALQNTVDQQQTKNKALKPSALKFAGSIAASFLLFIVVFAYVQTPAVITAAYADIKKDAAINNGMQPSLSQWMNESHLDPVPPQYKVEMSKYCQLDEYKTTHLRIAGAEQGMMHIFFHFGDHPIHWMNRSGVKDKMDWKLIKVRDDLTLIVMHTHDMRKEAVQHILGEILPELQA